MLGWVGIGLLVLAVAAFVANLVHQWRQPSMAKRLADARVGLSRSEWIMFFADTDVPASLAAAIYDQLEIFSGIPPHPQDRIRAHMGMMDFFELEDALAAASASPIVQDQTVREDIVTFEDWAIALIESAAIHKPPADGPPPPRQ